ncbi:uncharacterized protein Z520_12166 [Fonsecaea multimorphosa CBS 102226]|uniref:Major facilitator superfamily (MFS) profile domain-containing protein n=1 Tax=Fonsecaea multimorphosa CBS 102226 TaxID=1442371 RepID=A0A0D2K756_9EURO|nr:uncharacterized protein Z520_12166 [Fonsecaea multimorphosa CBS 102226]KIX92173.1 hypothetical protein Z520_12166 [Fonsecaea multimorphosa CBS 102226]OAL17538.1 hypothetical protein AYO22_11573 [Fonsecaea multimorphosa]
MSSSPTPKEAETATITDEVATTKGPHQVRPIHGWKWILTCVAIYLTGLLYGLDTTIAADVQPNIVKSLGHVEDLTWVGAGFPLGGVAVILPLGSAYGMFEIKRLYLASIILFEVGSAVCGAAPTLNALIVGRVIAGAGGAGMYLGVLNYLGTFTTLEERNLYNSIIGMVWGLGAILGPLVGGGFASSSATWRWSFYINLVIAGVMAPAFIFLLPTHQPAPDKKLWDKLRHMDWLGVVLIASIYTTYTLALTFGGAQWAWDNYRFILTITLCGLLLMAFVVTQYFAVLTTKENRLFPGHFLLSRTLVLCFISTSATVTVLFLGAYYIPLIFQFARSDSAIMAAVRLLPFIIFTITSILLNGIFMPKLGYYMPWYVASGAFTIVGASLMHTIDPHTSPASIYGYSILLGIGSGSAFQSAYSVAATKVKPHETAAAIGFINVAQTGTTVIALTIAGSIFQNVAFDNLKRGLAQVAADGGHNSTTLPAPYSDAEIHNAISGTQSLIFQQGNAQVRDAAVKAIIDAIDDVYIMGIAAGAVTLVSALLMKRERLFMSVVAGG